MELQWTNEKGFGLYSKETLNRGTFIGVFGYLSRRKGITDFFPPLFREKDYKFKTNFNKSMDGSLAFVNHACGRGKNCEFYEVKLPLLAPGWKQFQSAYRLQLSKRIFLLKVTRKVTIGKELLVHYGTRTVNVVSSNVQTTKKLS